MTLATKGPLVLTVYAGLGPTSIAELVAWAKANPGKQVFASFGVGSSPQLREAISLVFPNRGNNTHRADLLR